MTNVNLTKQLEDLKEQLPAALATWQESEGRKITVGWMHAASPEVIGALLKLLTTGLLASRETVQVYQMCLRNGSELQNEWVEVTYEEFNRPLEKPDEWGKRILYTAPPAPAVSTTVNFSENADADMCREWAWEQVKELVSTDGWDAGDCSNFFSFFCWGWDMRRQYNEQRPSVPADMNHEVRDGN